ncbi:dicarboxylate/amino acid:cation symporter [Hyphococcus luteus]|uniref:Dicarboxylate/amino acid:cation symporter n=1 Tax=Hyphococcus luteus TaxID=2058213 RepID=A0A2S7K6A1_9PROT|nr:dicarboxylate/amino acid:cation symporter [Marinicaulis flavus]PQA88045.1 dicarboxylate/amino acid:cation symporter [Marinicaulis flavus]
MPKSRFKYNSLNRRLDVLVSGKLWLQVLIAIVIGVAVGALFGPDLNLVSRSVAELVGEWLALPGRLFLALIRMVIIPLVASSIIMGLTAAGEGSDLKRIGVRFIVYVLTTTMAAASLGGGLAWLVGAGKDIAVKAPPTPSLKPDPATIEQAVSPIETISRDLPAMISNLIPQNISASILEQDMLAVVVFSLFIGIAVITADNRELTKPLVSLMGAVLEVCMTVIRTAMRFAPFAVFGLMAQTTALNGLNTLIDLAVYCAVVIGGLGLLLALYLVIVAVFGGMTPWGFLRAVAPVQLLAFSTSSSAAVMPLTMKTAVEKLGVPPSLAGAVAPLAATVNMAGTALYQSAAIVFLANIAGSSLSFGEAAFIMVTLTGASIGAPAAPGASIAVLSATATSFGIPLTGLALVLGVDRLLDMARTAVNVTGDLVACRLLSKGGPAAASAAPPAPSHAAPPPKDAAA